MCVLKRPPTVQSNPKSWSLLLNQGCSLGSNRSLLHQHRHNPNVHSHYSFLLQQETTVSFLSDIVHPSLARLSFSNRPPHTGIFIHMRHRYIYISAVHHACACLGILVSENQMQEDMVSILDAVASTSCGNHTRRASPPHAHTPGPTNTFRTHGA